MAVTPLELFGMGVAAGHHRGVPGDAQIGLAQPHAVLTRQPVEAPDGGMHQPGRGREGDRLGLHRCIDRDAAEVLRLQRAGLVCHSQALGQQLVELRPQPLAPMAQVRALVREAVLEEFLAGEVRK